MNKNCQKKSSQIFILHELQYESDLWHYGSVLWQLGSVEHWAAQANLLGVKDGGQWALWSGL